MFEGWSDFYIIVAPTAGALIGLMFVVVTLTADNEPRGMQLGSTVYITPIVFHFSAVLFVSALTAVPAIPPRWTAFFVGAIGLAGAVYAIVTRLRLDVLSRKNLYAPDLSDKLFYGALPTLAYGGLIAASLCLLAEPHRGTYVLAAALLAILFIGIRNAWDLVTAIVASLSKRRHDEGKEK